MKTKIIFKKLPLLMDYALAVAISSVPGIAESDAQTKALYQSMAKQLLAKELRNKHRMAKQSLQILLKYPQNIRPKAA